jgi:hypothetical protein
MGFGLRTTTFTTSEAVSDISVVVKIHVLCRTDVYHLFLVQVHEACTRMNTETILNSGACAYWTDGAGHQFHGRKCSLFSRVCYIWTSKVTEQASRLQGKARSGSLHLRPVAKM